MAYNKTIWNAGTAPAITAGNLNHIEEGIYSAHQNIAQIAGQQIPVEYLQNAVDEFIADNEAGLATKTDIAGLDSKLSSEIVDVNNDLVKVANSVGYIFPNWVKQRISSSGVISNSNNYILTDGFLNNVGETVVVTIDNPLVHAIPSYYNEDGSFYKKSSAFTEKAELLGAYKVRLELYYNTTGTVITEYIQECINAVTITLKGETLEDKFEELNEKIDNVGADTIPDYWQDEINDKVNEIKTLIYNQGQKANVSAFMISADNHYMSNSSMSPKLMKYIADNTSINLHVNCGDIIEDTSTHEGNLSRIKLAMDYYLGATDRLLLTQGNHDNGATVARGGVIAYNRLVTDSEWLLRTTNRLTKQPKMSFYKNGKAFYYDDDVQKIRFISIDAFENREYTVVDGNITKQTFATMTDEQVVWLQSAFDSCPTDYSIITFSHITIEGPFVNGQNIEIYSNTLNKSEELINIINTFKSNGGDYICHISGHLHHDFLDITNGIVEVIMLNDGTNWREASYWQSVASAETLSVIGDAPTKTIGTISECAFDVCIINRDTRTVNLIRIGAGVDRVFNY